jgi:hypothetical protein
MFGATLDRGDRGDRGDRMDWLDRGDRWARVEGLRARWRADATADRTGRSEQVLGLLRDRDRARAELLHVVGEWDRDQTWALDGALSPVGWLAHRAGLTRSSAARLVRTARFLAAHPDTADALAAGRITVEHLTLLATAATRRESLYPEHEHGLLDAAETLPPEEFRCVAQHWALIADDVLGRDATRQHDRRYLHVRPTFGGTVAIDGLLDPIGGAQLLATLEAADRPDPDQPGPDEPGHRPRTRPQRLADLLVALTVRGANGGSDQVRTAIDVVIDADTATGHPPADLTRIRCEIEGLGPVRPSSLRPLLPDAVLRRVVTAGSAVLDVGRPVRFATPTQRRALRIRDRGCVVPDCRRPAKWCDVQHVVPYRAGGPTRLRNLVLLCRRHHVMVDTDGWRLERTTTGQWELHPPPTPDPRAPP